MKEHSNRLLQLLKTIPRGTTDDSIREMGCYCQVTPVLNEVLGYGSVRGCYLGATDHSERRRLYTHDGQLFETMIDCFNAEVDEFPYQDGQFNCVLCC